MKYKYVYFDEYVDLEIDKLNLLIVENKNKYIELLTYLNNEYLGENIVIAFFNDDNEKYKSSEATSFIPNVFSFEFNNKKNTNALYKKLKNLYGLTLVEETKLVKEHLIKIMEDIAMDFEIELDIDEDIKIEDLFKLMDVRFREDYSSFFEKVLKYMKIMREICGTILFIFHNLTDYLTDDEIKMLVNDAKYQEIRILSIENCTPTANLENLSCAILDVDMCSIL